MYIPKTPFLAKKIFPKLTWDQNNTDNSVYLSFDDGPTPGVTNWVLDLLKEHDAKATFFCLGKNVVHHMPLFERILKEGHSVGNHTFNHLNAWKTSKSKYLADIQHCEKVFHSKLFRPPYGKLRPGMRSEILEQYKIIMWDIISYDFDQSITPTQCFENVINNVKPGSIIVFHDSEKAKNNLQKVLPEVLNYLKENNLKLKALV